jgi:hypothetical protein
MKPLIKREDENRLPPNPCDIGGCSTPATHRYINRDGHQLDVCVRHKLDDYWEWITNA